MRHPHLVLTFVAALVLSGCGGGGGGDGSPDDPRPSAFSKYMLVLNGGGTIRRYAQEDDTGRIHPTGDTTSVTDPRRATLNPSGSRLYLINSGGDQTSSADDGISVYDVGADGSLTEIAGSPFAGVDKSPSDLLMHPNGAFLYVLNSGFQSNTVTQFAVDALTGGLTEIGSEVATGGAGAGIAIDRTASYVYVCNVTTGDITQFAIQADGTLAEIGSEVASGGFTNGIAAHPSEPYVYCINSNDGTVTQYEIGVDGTLTEIGLPLEVRVEGNPPAPRNGLGAIEVHPTGNWVYLTHTNGAPRLYQYEVLANGTLSEIGTPQDVGSNAVFMRIDPTGRYIYVIGTSDNSISMFAVNADGTAVPVGPKSIKSPDAPRDILFLGGSPTLERVATMAYANDATDDEVEHLSIATDGSLGALGAEAAGSLPAGLGATFDGRFVYSIDGATDQVLPYATNASGELSPLTAAATGAAPTHSVVSPDGRYLYVLNATDETVSQFVIQPDGTLSPMDEPTAVTSTDPRHIAIHPSSKYAYVVQAGTKNVFGYLVASDGELLQFGARPVTGNGPTWITVHPAGAYAYATNGDDDTVSQFAVGSQGQLGSLSPRTVASGDNPSSIVVEPRGRFAYVANQGDSTITSYVVGADGQLTALGTPIAAPTAPRVLRADPSGRYLYAITDTAILRYVIGGSGALTVAPDSVAIDAADLVTVGAWE